jgi:hypothetical protein
VSYPNRIDVAMEIVKTLGAKGTLEPKEREAYEKSLAIVVESYEPAPTADRQTKPSGIEYL